MRVSVVCEFKMRYMYPHPLDLSEILSRSPNCSVVLHGTLDDRVLTWNQDRGFDFALDLKSGNRVIYKLFALYSTISRAKPDHIVCFSPLSLLASFAVQALNVFRRKVYLYYYCLELIRPSFLRHHRDNSRMSHVILFCLRFFRIPVFITGPCRAELFTQWYRLKKPPVTILNAALLRHQVLHDSGVEHASQIMIKKTNEHSINVEADYHLVCAGGLSKLNCLDEIIASLRHLPPFFRLNLIGPVNPVYLRILIKSFSDLSFDNRLIYHGVVEGSREILIQHLSAYSVGLALKHNKTDVDNENDKLYTPNKVFDYIAAGLPSVVSMNPETKIFEQRECSVLVESPPSPQRIAEALYHIYLNRETYALNVRKEFTSRFNYEHQARPLTSLILGQPEC